MQISSHAKEQQRKAVENQPTNYALLHQQQQFLSQPSLECTSFSRMKKKKKKKTAAQMGTEGLFHKQRASEIHFRHAKMHEVAAKVNEAVLIHVYKCT